ncbi:hypothetical protein Tco_1045264 [Tanacetum coccineum]|uniref:Uncharacterized protein n=1 Tax=Tanacetum coccineum TaxID=301880 RepID=A0ABQ5GTB8_9ASTR
MPATPSPRSVNNTSSWIWCRGLNDLEIVYKRTPHQLKTLFAAAQLKLDMKKAQKASKYDFCIQPHSKGSGKGSGITLEVPDKLVHKSSNKGAGMNPEVRDESDSNSSSSSSDSEVVVEDISSDEDEVTKKTDNAKTADAEKDTEVQVADE